MTCEEEDWRVKNAREGRAVYIPGKTDEEIAAEMAKKAAKWARISSRCIALKEGDWDALDTALPDTLEVLRDAGRVFGKLAWSDDLDQPGINSMLRLAARAVESLEAKELLALDRLDTGLRAARKGGHGQ